MILLYLNITVTKQSAKRAKILSYATKFKAFSQLFLRLHPLAKSLLVFTWFTRYVYPLIYDVSRH